MQPWLDQVKVALSSSQHVALDQIAHERSWTTLPAVEREQIAQELSQEALRCMDQGDQQASRLFDLALSIAPVSAKILLIQGIAFYQRALATQIAFWAERALERLQRAVEFTNGAGIEAIWSIKAHLLVYDLSQEVAKLEQAKKLWLSLSIQVHDSVYEAQRQAVGGNLWMRLARASGEPTDFQQAILLLRLALEQLPHSHEQQMNLGQCLVSLSKLLGLKNLMQEAVGCFEKTLEHDSLDRLTLIKLAQCLYDLYLQSGCRHLAHKSRMAYERAFEITTASIEELDQYASVAMLLAELEPASGSLKKFFAYSRLLKSDNHRLQLFEWHGRWLLAHQQDGLDQIRLLDRELRSHELKLTGDAHYWMLRGLCSSTRAYYFRESKELIEATEYFQKGLLIDQDRPGLWLHLARAYLFHSELQAHIDSAKKAIQLFSMAVVCGRYSEQFWIDWGLAFFRVADATGERTYLSESLLRFEKALEICNQESLPANYKLLTAYASALDFLGDIEHDEECYERAIQLLQIVLQAEPSNDEAKSVLAVALTHLGESSSQVLHLERAHLIFSQMCEVDHEDDFLWNEWGVCLLSMARIQKDESGALLTESTVGSNPVQCADEAIARLQRSYHLGNYHALYNLCCGYALKEDYVRAIDYLGRALEVGIHPPYEDMLEDEWLEPLREQEAFVSLMEEYQASRENLPTDSDPSEGGVLPS